MSQSKSNKGLEGVAGAVPGHLTPREPVRPAIPSETESEPTAEDLLVDALRLLSVKQGVKDLPTRTAVLKSLEDWQLKKLDGALSVWMAELREEFRAREL